MMDPAGPAAMEINWLWWIMLAGSSLIVIFVAGLIWYSFYNHFRASVDVRSKISTWIIGLGLIFPTTIIVALLTYGIVIGERLLPTEQSNVVKVEAVAEQWRWQFFYPDQPGYVSVNVMHIPSGVPVDVVITTRDVIHSFWVPRLAGKLDAIPGHVNTLRIQANAPGSYKGLSAEFSGAGYTQHQFIVQAHDQVDWARFLAGEKQ